MIDRNAYISKEQIRKQTVYFYLAPLIWSIYLVILPAVFSFNKYLAVACMIFPGLYLFTWLGYLMHECWHKYVPNVNNGLMYNVLALMILSDPQLYHIIHGSHHSKVHTWEDSEFHPLGEIKSRGFRIVYNWMEIIFGVAFLVVMASITVPRHKIFSKKYRYWKLFSSIFLWILFWGCTGYLSNILFGSALTDILISYGIMIWLGSFFLHQSQLVEHGNLIVEGNFNERNYFSRNLAPSGVAEKVFLFLTHNDSLEHVLHHTLTSVYSRPFPGSVPLPKDAIVITLKEYLSVIGRMLIGRAD